MRWASAAILIWLAGPAAAQMQSAGELRDMCFGRGLFADELKDKAEGVCWGFIAGVGDVLAAGNVVSGIAVCPPQGETALNRGETITAVKSYLDDTLADPEIPASVAIAKALAASHPCE